MCKWIDIDTALPLRRCCWCDSLNGTHRQRCTLCGHELNGLTHVVEAGDPAFALIPRGMRTDRPPMPLA
jgi:hypothetical protein